MNPIDASNRIKERPILFSAAMVRALLAGTKTQTRRVVKPHRRDDAFVLLDHGGGWWPYRSEDGERPIVDNMEYALACPYGKRGDRLWVKETWAQPAGLDPEFTVYRADYPACVPAGFNNLPAADEIKWKSSLFMPRAACRILLEVVSVRVERLNDCSEADARAEGTPGHGSIPGHEHSATSLEHYRHIWESINGAGSWDRNPWVWVVEFRRAQ
ncbi:hypothetical protein FHS02_000984 [Massilia umbonata]|uniref:Morphogenetic protein n=1 Tax=Pseudoduganella umbonata TaxID=864828 RepID=A0A7W5HAP8_9BURK|nr:hypothetical protein [Pseudoduganella umbonata]MBB3220197.1 hypothetical protein [Pseudoduganella umbonata]